MSTIRTMAGRALPLVLIGLAVAAIGVLFATDFFGSAGDAGTESAGDDGYGDEMTVDGMGDESLDETGTGDSIGLAGLYGDGDMGAVRTRLLWVAGAKPVVGQAVSLVNRKGAEVKALTTDQQGVALFGGIAPGRGYSLMIDGEGFQPVHIRGITIPKGDTKRLDDIYLGEHVVLRGRVIDVDGKPLPTASVSVFDGREAVETDGIMFRMVNMAMNLPSPREQTQTGDDGYFTLTSLEDGVYRLIARRSGYASEHEKDVVVQTDRSGKTLTLVLDEGSQLKGVVKDSVGRPIANARVIAIQESGRWMQMETPQREYTTTNEYGEYVLDTLSPRNQYRFGVMAKGFMPLFDTGAKTIEGSQVRDFELPVGGTLTGVVVDKATQKPIADASVAVFVGEMNWRRRDNGKQAASTIVRTGKDGTFELNGVMAGPVPSAQIKAVGYVTASYSQWTQNQWPDVAEEETTEVRVELERGGLVKGTVISADNKQPVAGATVLLDGGGWGGMMQGLPSTVTDENGQYQLVGVRPGNYTVVASADGFAPARAEDARVTMGESGGEHTVDLDLTEAGLVKGVIVDSNGEPVAGVRVRVQQRAEPQPEGQNANNRNNRRGRRGRGGSMTMRMLQNSRAVIDMTSVDGKFELRGVAAGRWVVVAESEEYVRSYSQPFRIGAGETEEVEVAMTDGAVLAGRVVDERGSGVRGARVRIGKLDDDQVRRVNLNAWQVDRQLEATVYTTDSEGRFRIENLEPGVTAVKVEVPDHITYYRRDLRVRAGEVYDGYTISMSKGETIQGTVRGADGKPIQGAYVAVTARENPREDGGMAAEGEEPTTIEPSMGAQTDAQGRFTIENVPADGSHSVVVWWATGHQSYRQSTDNSAIRRGVRAPSRDIDFKLKKNEPRPEGERRGRGDR
ncbi:MAG: carboxypeptidase regulatory-like domain-containing protein [Planctomycetota bacterium]|nr:carboxypeptidase regulatory-like domain-containing protein [Planctomycetota bacterium]